jgi:hypothetical protein
VRAYALGIIAPVSPLAGSLFGLSQNQALLLLFVVLPIVLAVLVFPLVAWRHRNDPKPVLTSEILAHGMPGRAEVLSVKALGSILDMRPMVRFHLRVGGRVDEEPFELEVVQSLPRSVIADFHPGDEVDVRVTEDRSAGAVVWNPGWGGR